MYEPLYEYFEKHLSKHQYDFVRDRSVTTNMSCFLQKNYEAMDKNYEAMAVTTSLSFTLTSPKISTKYRIKNYSLK